MKDIKVKIVVSAKMHKCINAYLQNIKKDNTMKCYLRKMIKREEYKRYIDYDIDAHFNDKLLDGYKVLEIVYTPEYYAMPKYLTTNDLQRLRKRCKTNSIMEFLEQVYQEIQI